VFTNFTAVQRIVHVYRVTQSNKTSPEGRE